MATVKQIFVLMVIWILDSVDFLVQYFGVKLYRLTGSRILGMLTPDEVQESRKPDVAEGFRMFVKGLEADDRLTLFRRLHMLRVIKNLFRVRVQNTRLLKAQPEILQIAIRRPVVIASMPRSGTTFLSRLLGEDPRARAPKLWEMAFPYLQRTHPDPRNSDIYRNVMMGQKIDSWQRGDSVHKVHAISPEKSEECVVLTRLSFWQHIECKRLPGFYEYESWFLGADHAHHVTMYKYYKQMLQLLSYQHEDKFFLLKGNIHLWSLKALREVFPDVRLIYIVRPLAEVIASFCSTYDHVFNFYGPVDAQYGKRMLRTFSEQTRRVVETFRKYDELPAGENPLFLVDYNEMIRDPLSMIGKIYSKFEIEMTNEAERKYRSYVETNPKDKLGKHEYSLEKYGLCYEDLEQDLIHYADYMKSIGFNKMI